jgi:hypothetical protein
VVFLNKKSRNIVIVFLVTFLAVVALNRMYEKHNTNNTENQRNIPSLEAAAYPLMDKDWEVNYRVNKQRIYFENIIPRFTFQGAISPTPDSQNGYIAVFINGKWTMNANQSMFITKKLNKGKHNISLQLKKKDGSDYGLKKNIVIRVR